MINFISTFFCLNYIFKLNFDLSVCFYCCLLGSVFVFMFFVLFMGCQVFLMFTNEVSGVFVWGVWTFLVCQSLFMVSFTCFSTLIKFLSLCNSNF